MASVPFPSLKFSEYKNTEIQLLDTRCLLLCCKVNSVCICTEGVMFSLLTLVSGSELGKAQTFNNFDWRGALEFMETYQRILARTLVKGKSTQTQKIDFFSSLTQTTSACLECLYYQTFSDKHFYYLQDLARSVHNEDEVSHCQIILWHFRVCTR